MVLFMQVPMPYMLIQKVILGKNANLGPASLVGETGNQWEEKRPLQLPALQVWLFLSLLVD